ncbi:hypothetical protein KR222_001246 [Zaprionus bogoriensis]|nr:hypothetical protein KR222_001246 [Zaprionus bogoriensis]
MTSLTLRLIVITLLAAAAVTATATVPASASTSTSTRSIGQRGRGSGGVSSTTTSTQAPTLRAPRQRRPPTTLPIDISGGSSSSVVRSRGSSTTPLPSTVRPQRRRGTPITTTAATPADASLGRASVSRGSIRAARQPRDTPTLGDYAAAGGASDSANSVSSSASSIASSSRRQSHQAPSSASTNPGKTPRMIQRLVAGHIHNAQGRSTYEVSAVSANSSSSIVAYSPTSSNSSTSSSANSSSSTSYSTTTTRPATSRKSSSSYRLARPSSRPSPGAIAADNHDDDDDDGDDEALLSEPDDFDNWDNGILRLSAGSGKETHAESSKNRDDGAGGGKKTLADQVRDGKYGLIEKELFRRLPKRPGVLSYARNPEVPLDNERNFGGLHEQDIWLAEDHLLVIKGGSLNEPDTDNADGPWPPIDDYDAPPRQIKLPANPVVAPPFPVQLEPHGPLQLIRDNQIEGLHPSPGNATLSAEGQHSSHVAFPQLHGAAHGSGAHSAARPGASAAPASADPQPSYVYPAPYAPWLLYPNETLGQHQQQQSPSHPAAPHPATANPLLRSPLLGPWLINGLNGNVSGPSAGSLPANISDFDEDDPSLYYPPAYSFVYRSNYSNPVPPGPLVPGIVLPPPPDHFSRLEGSASSSSTSSTTSTTTTTTSTTTTTTRRPPSSSISSNSLSAGSRLATPTSTPSSRLSLKYSGLGYLPPNPAPLPASPKYVERVPVPVAVPIPIYPINYQPTTPRPHQQLVFVPSTERGRERERERDRERERERERDLSRLRGRERQGERDAAEDAPLSKSNPIYYEYFEAKRQPGTSSASGSASTLKLKPNVIEDFLATKPAKAKPKHRTHYKSPPSPVNDVGAVGGVVSITPKPLLGHVDSYDTAVGQLIRSNLIAPPPAGAGAPLPAGARFHAPDFDRQPFLPMVNYSADEHDQNAFKAIVYQPSPQPQPQRQRQLRVGKYQHQLQLEPAEQPDLDPNSAYLPDALLLQRQRQLRIGKQQLQQQQQGVGGVYSTPTYLDNQLQSRPAQYQLRPPAPAPPLQFWQRPAASSVAQQQPQHSPPPPPPPPPPLRQQYKRLRHGGASKYPPYFVPSYASAPAAEPLYRLLPVPQHKHWRQQQQQQQQPGAGSSSNSNHKQQQIQLQPQQQYYPQRDGGVAIGHSLASDILVNYNSNNQFNPQAELVPQAQLGPPPPLSYQAQSGGQAALWSDRPVRQSRAQLQLPEQV